MKQAGKKSRAAESSVRSLLHKVGRLAIWIVVGLLLLRGLGAVAAAPEPAASLATPSAGGTDPVSASFAIRFARTFLTDPSTQALAPFMAEGSTVASGRAPSLGAEDVSQAEISSVEKLAGNREVLTVACELRDARTLYLAVPIARSEAGEVAALGAPSIVAGPAVAGAASERPQPLAGSGAEAIGALVSKFLPEYLSGTEPSDLSYLVAPGAEIEPLGGVVTFASITALSQLGSAEGARRVVLASVLVKDPTGGAAYPLVYRLALVRGSRWYVEAIEGASA